MVCRCSSIFHEAGTAYFMVQTFKTRFKSYLMYFLWSILGKLLGFSVFLVLDTLKSISCHLRAIGGRLNDRF